MNWDKIGDVSLVIFMWVASASLVGLVIGLLVGLAKGLLQ